MKIIQDMSNRELIKARFDAFTQLLLGANNTKAIEAFDREIKRRKVKEETR